MILMFNSWLFSSFPHILVIYSELFAHQINIKNQSISILISFPAEQKTAQMEKYEIIYEKTKPIVLEICEAQVA